MEIEDFIKAVKRASKELDDEKVLVKIEDLVMFVNTLEEQAELLRKKNKRIEQADRDMAYLRSLGSKSLDQYV